VEKAVGWKNQKNWNKALEQAFKSDKPAIVDVAVNPEKMAPEDQKS